MIETRCKTLEDSLSSLKKEVSMNVAQIERLSSENERYRRENELLAERAAAEAAHAEAARAEKEQAELIRRAQSKSTAAAKRKTATNGPAARKKGKNNVQVKQIVVDSSTVA